ncbi:GNAT family N-acetyltransferase [Chungangia koreensis]|uniref:GNAT family N-acetyltransferase n=1 Tax=Chungangia koreensis TaxID=752657 RepID=A0ABV8X8H0_9LACT
MIHFKSLDTLSFKEASELFNKGFEGYSIPMSPPLDAYVARFGNEGLSPECSVVMLEDEKPIGFVLQGIREVDGKKISWNGGTGIIPSHRGKGLGRQLMEGAEQVLREKGVHISTLEALSMNEPAIRLYQSVGYDIEDQLLFLEQEGRIEYSPAAIATERFPAFQAIGASIFNPVVPWQIDPANTPKVGGEVLVAKRGNDVIAAVLFRKRQTNGKEIEGITLFQAVAEETDEGLSALKALLAEAMEFTKPVKRTTYNFQIGDGRAVDFLKSVGFKETNISQVFMVKEL